ncbi:glycosyltransferase [Geodermatophilus sp. SYSU D01105]
MTTADPRLQDNRRAYEQVVDAVRSHARRGDVEQVLRTAAVAAAFAYNAPTGALSDPDLERLVRDAVRGDGAVRVDRGRGNGRVLHVLSEGYAVGGHTRLVWRWMERDPRPADVVLTMQHAPVPGSLRAAAERAGGRIYDLREGFPALAARAEVLRGLMAGAGTVVFHVHPYDTVALAAASLPGPRPPIVHENHADHTFWLGLGSADLVVENRAAGRRVSRELRGVPEHRLAVLPLPVQPVGATASRKSIRAQFRLRPGQVAAISVATAMKMAPIWGRGFDELLAGVLSEIPQLAIVLAGPTADGPWQRLQSGFPGRVFPLGLVEGVEGGLYPGMDLYLDSFPCASGTSILEAAVAGLPPVSLQLHQGYAEVFHANAPGLAETGYAQTSEDAYVAALRALVEDPQLRRDRGERARSEVLAAHSGPAWNAALEQVYRQAHEVPAADLDEFTEPGHDNGYGSTLLPFTLGRGVAPEPAAFGRALGQQMDDRLRCDLFVAAQDRSERRLSVRVARGWEDHAAWTMRLVQLAHVHPGLTVSLPLVADDDGSGARSVQVLGPLLAAIGLTTDDCGDLNLDPGWPRFTGPALAAELSPELSVLEQLELILGSPLWDDAPRGRG